MLLVDTAHERSSRRQDLIDEDEDGLLWRKLDALADDIDELADCEICGDQVLLLVDGCDVGLLDFLADHLEREDAISVYRYAREKAARCCGRLTGMRSAYF